MPSDREAQLEARKCKFRNDERAALEAGGGQATVELESYSTWLPRQEKCDLLLTDPPFSTDIEDIDAFARDWLPAALDSVKSTGNALVFVGAYPAELHAYFQVRVPTQLLVWNYRNTLGRSPKRKFNLDYQAILFYQGENAPDFNITLTAHTRTVQTVNAPDGRLGDRLHKWQKPLGLIQQYVKLLTKPDDLVLDPFAGSGTHLVAAATLGRKAKGCDIDSEAIALCTSRGVRHP